jgi:hypothetical protein
VSVDGGHQSVINPNFPREHIRSLEEVRFFFASIKPQNQYGAQSLGATARRGVCPRPHVGFFFIFFFSSFPLLTIFLIHKLGAQLILWNKLCTQLDIYRKSYVHNLSLKKYTHKLFFE